MWYDSVIVNIQAAVTFQVGLINKLFIVTGEDDVQNANGTPLKLSGLTAVEELETWLTDNSKVAPKLVEGVRYATTQNDESGNPIVPDFIYAGGVKITDYPNALDISTLTDFIESYTNPESDFWMVIPVEQNILFNTWAQMYTASNRKAAAIWYDDKTYVPTDNEQSARIIAIYNGQESGTGYDRATEQWSSAWAGRCVTPSSLTAWKFRTLNGCTSYKYGEGELTDAEVATLYGNGINSYLYRWDAGSTDGSLCTDKSTHIDSMFIRDNIVFNMIKNVYGWLKQSEFPSMEDVDELTATMEAVLDFAVDSGLIATIDNVKQYKVVVPEPTAQERADRWIKNAYFEYLPNIPVEKVTITGQELLEAIGGAE